MVQSSELPLPPFPCSESSADSFLDSSRDHVQVSRAANECHLCAFVRASTDGPSASTSCPQRRRPVDRTERRERLRLQHHAVESSVALPSLACNAMKRPSLSSAPREPVSRRLEFAARVIAMRLTACLRPVSHASGQLSPRLESKSTQVSRLAARAPQRTGLAGTRSRLTRFGRTSRSSSSFPSLLVRGFGSYRAMAHESWDELCTVCDKAGTMRCGSCKVARFCSARCQAIARPSSSLPPLLSPPSSLNLSPARSSGPPTSRCAVVRWTCSSSPP